MRSYDVDNEIQELHAAGWSERRIAAALGVTRHRVRIELESLRPTRTLSVDGWTAEVELLLGHAKLRTGDEEQMELGVLALDVAEWLDDHRDGCTDAEALAGSLAYIVQGVTAGSNPLVRIHKRRARGLLAAAGGRPSHPPK